jgi:hypothetical protein
MDCKAVRENLVAFVDRGLSPEQMREIERHLGECPDCEREHRRLAKFTTSLVELLEPLRPSRSFKESVITTVTTHERRGMAPPQPSAAKSTTERILIALVAGLILASMVGAAVLILRSTPPAGKLVVEAGSATILHYRGGSWQAVPARREILPGERVATSADSRAVLRLEGASVTVGGETTVQVESSPEALRIHFASPGKLYADVNILRDFQVVAQQVRVTLGRGAACVELRADGVVVVSAVEGSPRVSSPDVTIQLAGGRELEVPQTGKPGREPVAIPERRLEWLGRPAGPPDGDAAPGAGAVGKPTVPGDQG